MPVIVLFANCFTGSSEINSAALSTHLQTHMTASHFSAERKSPDRPCTSGPAPQEVRSSRPTTASANSISLNPMAQLYTLRACLRFISSALPQQHLRCEVRPSTHFLTKQPHRPTEILRQPAAVHGCHRSFVSGLSFDFYGICFVYADLNKPAQHGP